jgi:hypothetical protein
MIDGGRRDGSGARIRKKGTVGSEWRREGGGGGLLGEVGTDLAECWILPSFGEMGRGGRGQMVLGCEKSSEEKKIDVRMAPGD